MGILDKVQGDANLIVDRANKKIEQLNGLTTKLLLPKFKAIVKDLKDLGVDLRSIGDLIIDSPCDFLFEDSLGFLYFTCHFEDAKVGGLGVYIDGAYVLFDASKPYVDKINLPALSGSITVGGNGTLTLNSDNISEFEKYMDELMSYITRNNTLIVETIEDVVLDILKKTDKL